MKITRARLKEIIREELQKVVVETGPTQVSGGVAPPGEGGEGEGEGEGEDAPKQDPRYIKFTKGTTITGG